MYSPEQTRGAAMRTTTEPRRYQTNASLSQPPIKAAHRPVREYVTNLSWRASGSTPNRPTAPAHNHPQPQRAEHSSG
jgi:hypothetical protein